MAIPIKINCDCGQHYAFDVEPVGGRMPTAIACPACGADGTPAANDAITHAVSTLPSPVAFLVEQPRLRVAAIATAAPNPDPALAAVESGEAPAPRLIDHSQAIHEARAKIFWGDSRQQAIVCLVAHGIEFKEAGRLVDGIMKDRAATIRVNGIRKIFTGAGLMMVPVVALAFFLYIKFLPIKIFAITVMIGLWGAWQVIKGTFMMVAPKAEAGDVASH